LGIKLGILASTNATDLQAVIDAIAAGELDAEIACLISNKQDANALERAQKHGIEAIFLNPNDFGSREEFDKKVVQLLVERNVQLVLLIGYNKFLSQPFLNAFEGKAVNIHPSLLPDFKGWYTDVYKAVLEAGVKETGCTLHFVSKEADAGKIIAQKKVPVLQDDDINSLKRRVQAAEQEVILSALKEFAAGKALVE